MSAGRCIYKHTPHPEQIYKICALKFLFISRGAVLFREVWPILMMSKLNESHGGVALERCDAHNWGVSPLRWRILVTRAQIFCAPRRARDQMDDDTEDAAHKRFNSILTRGSLLFFAIVETREPTTFVGIFNFQLIVLHSHCLKSPMRRSDLHLELWRKTTHWRFTSNETEDQREAQYLAWELLDVFTWWGQMVSVLQTKEPSFAWGKPRCLTDSISQ